MPSSRETSFLRYDNGTFVEQDEVIVSETAVNVWLDSMHLESFVCSPGNEDALILGNLLSSGTILNADEVQGVTSEGADYTLTLTNTNEFVARFLSTRLGAESTPRALPQVKSEVEAISNDLLDRLYVAFSASQVLHSRTGGSHGAMLFDIVSGKRVQVEDIGRHNAVDKAIGLALETGVALSQSLLFISGRLTSEIVQKAAFSGIPVLVSLAVASDMGVQVALNAGITLLGSFKESGYWVYNEGLVKVKR
jgi:FdhD protein